MASNPKAASSSAQKRGFFGKLKDSVIGTKEEREAERKRSAQVRFGPDLGLFWRSAEFLSGGRSENSVIRSGCASRPIMPSSTSCSSNSSFSTSGRMAVDLGFTVLVRVTGMAMRRRSATRISANVGAAGAVGWPFRSSAVLPEA